MNKTTIKKEVTKFKTRIRRKSKFSKNKVEILKFCFGCTDKLVDKLKIEFELQPSFDIKERLNELI